jgi:hypothetical protein
MQLLKLSTAATVVVGPVLDADGVAVTTAVAADFSIAKNGSVAAFSSETITHSTNGYYTIGLTSSNTNTLGRLDILVNNSAMAMSNHRYDVIFAQTYDSIVSGSDLLQVDIRELGGSTQNADRILIGANSNRTVQVTGSNHVAADVHEFQAGVITEADFADGAISARVIATNAIDADSLASDAVTEIQVGLAKTADITNLQNNSPTEAY